MKGLCLSLVISLSFFTFYSDSAFTESWEYDTAYPFTPALQETETVFITINQVSPTETAHLTSPELVTTATANEHPVEIHLENTTQAVKTVNLEVCDEDDYLTLTSCVTTDRTAGFLCRANESSTGCCNVRLFSMFPGITIAEGSGPIFLLNYLVSEEAPVDECRTLDTANSEVTDPSGIPLDTIVSPGEYCFSAPATSCEVTISPEDPDDVLSGETIPFSAHTTGAGCVEPSYRWEITGDSDAVINDSGMYSAGSAGGWDEVTVWDDANDCSASTQVFVIQDSDNDGIPDDEEVLCAESNFESTVIIDECDTVIENHLFENGCTMSDLIAHCADSARNHGRFVLCVARLSIEWKRAKLIGLKNMGALVRCAARADIP